MRMIDAESFERELMFKVSRVDVCDDCMLTVLEQLKNAPTVEPEVKRGYWAEAEIDLNLIVLICSECGIEFYGSCDFAKYVVENFNFCPNCGADMREEE